MFTESHTDIDLSCVYSFTQGHPVPDGMVYSEVSPTNYPSNIVVSQATSISNAHEEAMISIRSGKQALVWLPPEPYDGRVEQARDRRTASHIIEMRRKYASVRPVMRTENESMFRPHLDFRGNIQRIFDQMAKPLPEEVTRNRGTRILLHHYGLGVVLFHITRESNEALWENKRAVSVAELGPAYLTPEGSVTFLAGCDWGLERACAHSSPHVPKATQSARELTVLDCIPQ